MENISKSYSNVVGWVRHACILVLVHNMNQLKAASSFERNVNCDHVIASNNALSPIIGIQANTQ